ncbi:MAG TPA: MGMT family protein [Thermoleophilaceae bacterium]|nr:MGMT family protein [Thermoleophilaceae bacterium]
MTEAEERVVAAVRAIPEGFVRTYGDVSPGAPRLAGQVLTRTHEPDLPWWRVVRADGSLAVGDDQRARLEAEGVPFLPGPRGRVDMGVARMVGPDG